MTVYVIVHFGRLLVTPNAWLLKSSDDGIKNYFVLADFVKNGDHPLHLSGMNYPYGEFLLLEDAHPVLALMLKSISAVFPGIADYSIGIVNFLLLATLVVSAGLMFSIFRHFKTQPILAIAGSIAIPAMSSQILLWGYGHWALGYVCFFPLGWWLTIRMLNRPSATGRIWLVAVNTLFWLYIHPYLGLMLLMFNLISVAVAQLNEISSKKNLTKYLVCILLPLIFYVASIKIMDTHHDRPEGFFMPDHLATWRSIFVSNETFTSPLASVFNADNGGSSWDRVGNFLGLTTIITLLLYTGFMVVNLAKRKISLPQLFKNQWSVYWSAAIVALLFAMGWPLKFFTEVDMGPLSVLLQFTGYGRFAWVFYFIATTFAVVLLSRYFFNTAFQRTITVVLMLMFLVEGYSYSHKISQFAPESENMFTEKFAVENLAEEIEQILGNDYQAIIALPFFYHYGNPYSHGSSAQSIHRAMMLSYHSGLPMLNAYLSRPSITEGRKIMQVFSPPTFTKEIVADLHSDKPFLIFHTGQELHPNEQNMIDRATPLFSTTLGKFYSLSLERAFGFDNSPAIHQFEQRKSDFINHKALWVSDSTTVFFESFDDVVSEVTFIGSGVFVVPGKGRTALAKFSPDNPETAHYEASLWFYNENIFQTFTNVEVEVINSDSSRWSSYHNPFHGEYILGNWSLVTANVTLEPGQSIAVYINADTPFGDAVNTDNLLIRKRGADVFQEFNLKQKKYLLKNNRPLEFAQ